MASGVYSWCEEHWNRIILLYIRRHRKREKNTKTCYLDKYTVNTLFKTLRKPRKNIRLSENTSCERLDTHFSALPNKKGKKNLQKKNTIVLFSLQISDLSVLCLFCGSYALCSGAPKPVQIQSFLVLNSGQTDAVEQARNSLGYYFFFSPREALKNTEQNMRNRVKSNVTF